MMSDLPSTTARRSWRGSVTRLLLFPLVAYGVVLLLMLWLENQLIYIPVKQPLGSWRPRGLPVEDAWFESADGTRLNGWYLHHEQPRAVLLIAGGNSGNISYWAGLLSRLHAQHDLAVMVFDYRGYGRSAGHPDESGLLADARAARAWLAGRTGVAETDVVLLGRSLGGGVMTDLAAFDGCRGLVLQSTFTSLVETAAWHYPWLPVRTCMQTRFDSLAKIGNYPGPLLQSHGDADEVVPLALGQRLFEAAPGPKQFVLIPGGRHNDVEPDEYYRVFDTFIDSLPASLGQ